MTFRRLFTLAALAGALMLATNTAQAGYTFTTANIPNVVNFGNSQVTIGSESSSGTLSGVSAINVANVTLTSTTIPPATDTTSFNLGIGVAITNVPPPGTSAVGLITFNGTLAFTRSDSGGEISSFTLGAITNNGVNIGGVTYTLSSLGYTPPTVNGGAGNISVLVTPNFVPEPASMIMLGCGLVGVAGLGLRRMKKA